MWPSLFPRMEIAERHKYLSKVIEYLQKSTFSQDPVVGAVVEVQQAEGMELKRAGCIFTLPQAFGVLPGSLLRCTGGDEGNFLMTLQVDWHRVHRALLILVF